MASLTYVLDSFHEANHTACLDEAHALYLPEVRRCEHGALQGINSQTAEQFFAWADAFVGFASNMAPYVFRTFLLILAHWFNVRVAQQLPQRCRRKRSSARAARPPSTSRDAGTGQPRQPAPRISLQRNPHGVGFWGGGKYHWRPAPGDLRPPCRCVTFATLSQVVTVAAEAVTWELPVGFVVRLAGSRYELCKLCGSALRRSGQLDTDGDDV